ncbi:hypothetical protein G9A89_015593 [Geosiphon pyriformis]|nr:hypothetical protein G9A89_015593 [Geosiphon pyriformis]
MIEERPSETTINLINQHLVNHFAFPAVELVKKHPPRWFCKNKKLVYELSCPEKAESFHGTLEYSRWKEFNIPKKFPNLRNLQIETQDGVFDYCPHETANTVPWYLNFADSNVFGYYGGRLFAQDESQCLEHPALCSLRESLSRVPFSTPTLTTVNTTQKGTIATPILIRGVERRAEIKTDRNEAQGRPCGLYGNQFAIGKPEAIVNATTVFDQRLDHNGRPYYSNILAMEAPKYGNGKYSAYTIRRILATAYTGFLAARFESMVEVGMLKRNHAPEEPSTTIPQDLDHKQLPIVIIHTGNWGCGAYGGNIAIMGLLQVAAAQLAGVHKFVYHAMGSANEKKFKAGLEILKKLRLEKDGELSVDAFVQDVEKENFEWGVTNGT